MPSRLKQFGLSIILFKPGSECLHYCFKTANYSDRMFGICSSLVLRFTLIGAVTDQPCSSDTFNLTWMLVLASLSGILELAEYVQCL